MKAGSDWEFSIYVDNNWPFHWVSGYVTDLYNCICCKLTIVDFQAIHKKILQWKLIFLVCIHFLFFNKDENSGRALVKIELYACQYINYNSFLRAILCKHLNTCIGGSARIVTNFSQILIWCILSYTYRKNTKSWLLGNSVTMDTQTHHP